MGGLLGPLQPSCDAPYPQQLWPHPIIPSEPSPHILPGVAPSPC